MRVKTTDYDVKYKYPTGSNVYIKNRQFTTKPYSSRQIPFGVVVRPPTRDDIFLEIELYPK